MEGAAFEGLLGSKRAGMTREQARNLMRGVSLLVVVCLCAQLFFDKSGSELRDFEHL